MKEILLLIFLFSSQGLIALQICNENSPRTTPNERFIISNQTKVTTVIDIETGLMWKQCLEGSNGEGCQYGKPLKANWREALALARTADDGLYNDWRIPTKTELASLVEAACANPAINQMIFPGAVENFVWSSTQYVTRRHYFAWGIDFSNGNKEIDFQVADNSIRLVRTV